LTNNATVKAVAVQLPNRFSHVELCAIDIFTNSTIIRLFYCYRPPCSNRDSDGLKYILDLCNCIQYLIPVNRTVIICGDFNFPNIDWTADNCIKQSNTGVLLNLSYNNGFREFVNSPTRLDNQLDLVLCNDSSCIVHTRVTSPFSTSDHNTV
jgi:Endonuclease-reverse transcriptase